MDAGEIERLIKASIPVITSYSIHYTKLYEPLSDLYVSPIPIERTTTLKAKAFRADLAESATATAGFTENLEATPLLPGLQLV